MTPKKPYRWVLWSWCVRLWNWNREVKYRFQGHSAQKGQSSESNPGSLTPETALPLPPVQHCLLLTHTGPEDGKRVTDVLSHSHSNCCLWVPALGLTPPCWESYRYQPSSSAKQLCEVSTIPLIYQLKKQIQIRYIMNKNWWWSEKGKFEQDLSLHPLKETGATIYWTLIICQSLC